LGADWRHRVREGQDRRNEHDPEALVASARRDEPGERKRNRVGDPGECPRGADRETARRQWARRLVHAVDLEVVDLIERVARGVEDSGHQRADERRGPHGPRPGLGRHGTDRGDRAGEEAKRGRDQRERPRELDVLPHASMRQAASASAAAVKVVMKFNRSLSRIPRSSNVEPSTLSTSAATTAATATGRISEGAMIRSDAAMAASSSAAAAPAAVPSDDTAPDVPGGTRRNDVTSHVRRPYALPTSLDTVSLDPAITAATNATSAASR